MIEYKVLITYFAKVKRKHVYYKIGNIFTKFNTLKLIDKENLIKSRLR